MRRFAAIAIAIFLVVACEPVGGSGSSAGNTAPSSCAVSADCPLYDCMCADGTTQPKQQSCSGGKCASGVDTCTPACVANGGVGAAYPRANVIGSAECDAFCAKIDALSCSRKNGGTQTCGAGWNCSVNDFNGTCAESVREVLACIVQTGTFACVGDQAGFTANCYPNSSACP